MLIIFFNKYIFLNNSIPCVIRFLLKQLSIHVLVGIRRVVFYLEYLLCLNCTLKYSLKLFHQFKLNTNVIRHLKL